MMKLNPIRQIIISTASVINNFHSLISSN